MNSATLKTIREAVGLTVQSAADRAGVALRTWQRWEAPDFTGTIPSDVVWMLGDLMNRLCNLVDEALETADKIGGEITITRYRTEAALNRNHPGFPGGLPAHNAIVSAVLTSLNAENLTAVILWDDDPTAIVGADWGNPVYHY